ncbi:hypothetical protein MJT46_003533 [Ovis ammon polii x Ovis aries]|nr:hypothetical protein MJT46_003533 [Ovis ammon polii x Ovis aries]
MESGRKSRCGEPAQGAAAAEAALRILCGACDNSRSPRPRGREGRAERAAAQSPAQSSSTGDTGRMGPTFPRAAGAERTWHPSALKSLQRPNSVPPPIPFSLPQHVSDPGLEKEEDSIIVGNCPDPGPTHRKSTGLRATSREVAITSAKTKLLRSLEEGTRR